MHLPRHPYLCNDDLPLMVKFILESSRLCSSFLGFFFFLVFSFFLSDKEFVNSIFGISFIKLHCFV